MKQSLIQNVIRVKQRLYFFKRGPKNKSVLSDRLLVTQARSHTDWLLLPTCILYILAAAVCLFMHVCFVMNL